MVHGTCHCGETEYVVHGEPFDETNCHCSICRRTTGAPFVSWASFPSEGFEFTRGTPIEYASTPLGIRYFCGRCGCQLAYRYHRHPQVDVSLGSLDPEAKIAPRDHTRASDKLPWVNIDDGLPIHMGKRPGD